MFSCPVRWAVGEPPSRFPELAIQRPPTSGFFRHRSYLIGMPLELSFLVSRTPNHDYGYELLFWPTPYTWAFGLLAIAGSRDDQTGIDPGRNLHFSSLFYLKVAVPDEYSLKNEPRFLHLSCKCAVLSQKVQRQLIAISLTEPLCIPRLETEFIHRVLDALPKKYLALQVCIMKS